MHVGDENANSDFLINL